MSSSKGGYDLNVDEKKMKRMISNRESARRSRMKKEQHMKDLNDQIFYFRKKRDELLIKIEGIAKASDVMEMENMVLRSQKDELEKRLEYAKHVSGCWYEGDDGHNNMTSSMGNNIVQEPWLRRTWEQKQPVMSSSSSGFSIF